MPHASHIDSPDLIPQEVQRQRSCFICHRLFLTHWLQDAAFRWLFCPYCGARRRNPGFNKPQRKQADGAP